MCALSGGYRTPSLPPTQPAGGEQLPCLYWAMCGAAPLSPSPPPAHGAVVQLRSHFAEESDAAPARCWGHEGVGDLQAPPGVFRQVGVTPITWNCNATDPSDA